jgi:bifunctional non-homologous end joining protein LigD
MDPRDRRLAVQVEDHPLDYMNFEGRIPEGEYGAGLVEIWDNGTYSLDPESGGGRPARSMTASLKKGHIDLSLHGKKLSGRFTLIRLKDKERQWLLIKRKDPSAVGAAGGTGPANPPSPERLDLLGAVKASFPDKISPMLATLIDGPFDREGWSFEVKWDGHRSIAAIRSGKVRLVSRNGKSQNARFPTVIAALNGFPVDAVFDGEVVAVDSKGRPDFQALQNSRGLGEGRILYYVFDVLYAAGYDLRALPLRQRRAVLLKLLPVSKSIRLSESIEKSGRAYFRAAQKMGLEGIMAKDLSSPYRSGERTRDWLKIKNPKKAGGGHLRLHRAAGFPPLFRGPDPGRLPKG